MRKIILSGMLSNGLEWYDYALYAFTALTISKQFFPAGDETAHLLATFGIFAVLGRALEKTEPSETAFASG